MLCRGHHANGQCVMHSQSQKEPNYMGNQDQQGNYWSSYGRSHNFVIIVGVGVERHFVTLMEVLKVAS